MPIPLATRSALAADPFMRVCAHRAFMDNPTSCSGRVEFEHAMSGLGRNRQDAWAIVPICTFHHRGKGLVKSFNVLIALCRATDDQLRAASKSQDLILLRTHYLKVYAPLTNDRLARIPKAPNP